MKKQLISAAVSAVLVFSAPAFSTGIPVVDVTAIAKTVQEGLLRAQEAKAALDQAMREYDQAKNIGEDAKRRFEGFSDFSGGFDTASSYMQDSLSKITDDAKSDMGGIRDKYELKSEDKDIQNRYDSMLQKIKFYDDFNTSVGDRAKRIETLQRNFNNADTPQKKADLANQLSTEQMTLDMQIKQYDLAERQMAAINTVNQEKASDDFFKKALGVN